MKTDDGIPVDAAPLPPVTQAQAEAAARTVVRLAPDDHKAILRALGLLRDGRIQPPPGILGGREIVNPKRLGLRGGSRGEQR